VAEVALELLGAFQLRHLLLHQAPRRARPGLVARLEAALLPLRPVSSYGLFAVMTRERREIVIEGSNDGRVWLPYELPHKPGDLARAPRWVAPGQPRLDWQMWFAALSPLPPHWFSRLLQRLLEGSPEVLALFQHVPFPDHPPRLVRALMYRYRFTDRETWRATGACWRREPLGLYHPVVALAGGPDVGGRRQRPWNDAGGHHPQRGG
jgi:hypothetical protein